MTKIQAVLILFSLLAITFATVIFRSRLWYRLLTIFFFFTAICFVLFPNVTNVIAHHVGVSRGADLLLYLTVFAVIYAFLLLYMKIRKLEQKITEQIRSMAIRDAQFVSAASKSDALRSRSASFG